MRNFPEIMWELRVSYRGRPVSVATVNDRMESGDPGTWGDPDRLLWSDRVMAGYAADAVRVAVPHWDCEVVGVTR